MSPPRRIACQLPNIRVLFMLCRLLVATAKNCGSESSLHGRMLRDHTLKTLETSHPLDCIEECHASILCQSINYSILKGICELNIRTREAKAEAFVAEMNHLYMKRWRKRVPLGSTAELPAESCGEIKRSEGAQTTSGAFWLHSSITPGEASLVYCDMITEDVLDPVAWYPLDGAHGTKEINNRVGAGVASGVHTAPGPDGKPDGSYEFSGTVNSYIEFPNGGGLDVKNSITMLCWLYPGGQDGPLFNYRINGSWGVHLWVQSGQLFVRFTKRDYSFTNALPNTHLKPKDGWKFVGASYDQANGDAKLWVDGLVVQTLNIGANLQLATQDNVRMGVKVGDGRYFKGRIAQMQVYNVALTQEQIKVIYKTVTT